MSFLSGLRGGPLERKSAKGASTAVSRAVSSSASARGGYFVGGGAQNMQRDVDEAYERIMWVFRCVDAIATNQARLPILLTKKAMSGEKASAAVRQNKKFWTLLNVRPNSYEDAFQFRYRLSSQALLSDRGVFVEIVGDPTDPDSLHLLPPTSVTPIPGIPDASGAMKFVERYDVSGSSGQIYSLKPEQVIWIKLKPHPMDPYRQMTPLTANRLAVETDWLARLFNRNFLLNDGRPGLLITIKGQTNSEDAAEIKRRFSGGVHQAGRATVIEAEDLNVADLSASPRDTQWNEMLKGTKEDFLIAFGTPESVLGNASGRTWDNAETERTVFWMDTMVPHCDGLASGLDRLTGDEADDEVFAMDYSGVDVLQNAIAKKHAKADADFGAGLITHAEWREARGMTVIDHPAAHIITMPNGFILAKSTEDAEAALELPNLKSLAGPEAPGMEPGADPAALSAVARQGALDGARAGQREVTNINAAATVRNRALALTAGGETKGAREQVTHSTTANPPKDDDDDSDIVDAVLIAPYEEGHRDITTTTEALLNGVVSRQAKVIPDRMDHAKVRKGTRHWDYGDVEAKVVRNIDPSYIVEVDRWAADMRADFEAALRPLLRKEANRAAREIRESGVLARMIRNKVISGHGKTPLDQLFNGHVAGKDEAVEKVLQDTLNVIEASVRYRSQKISELVQRLDEEGKTLKQIQDAVRKQIGVRSDWRKKLAVGMATSSIEGVREKVYAKTGRRITKTWNTAEDERVRGSHMRLEGVTISSTTDFTVGGAKMARPGDPRGPIHEVAGCRCWLTYQVK